MGQSLVDLKRAVFQLLFLIMSPQRWHPRMGTNSGLRISSSRMEVIRMKKPLMTQELVPPRQPESDTTLGEICLFSITFQNDNCTNKNRQVTLALPIGKMFDHNCLMSQI